MFKEKIIKKFSELQFYVVTVTRLNCENNITHSHKMYVTDDYTIYNSNDRRASSDTFIYERTRYNRFYGFATSNKTDESTYFASSSECDLDEHGNLVSLCDSMKGFPPSASQIICGTTVADDDRQKPVLRWFKCSRQFYLLIRYIRGELSMSVDTLLSDVETGVIVATLKKYGEKLKDTSMLSHFVRHHIDTEFYTESFNKIPGFYRDLLCDCLDIPNKPVSEFYKLFRSKMFTRASTINTMFPVPVHKKYESL